MSTRIRVALAWTACGASLILIAIALPLGWPAGDALGLVVFAGAFSGFPVGRPGIAARRNDFRTVGA